MAKQTKKKKTIKKKKTAKKAVAEKAVKKRAAQGVNKQAVAIKSGKIKQIWDSIKGAELHPLLFALYPVLFIFGHNVGELYFGEMIPYLIITFLTVSLAYFMTGMFMRDYSRAALVLTPLLLIFFFYGKVYYLLEGVALNEIPVFTHFRMLFFLAAFYAAFLIFVLETQDSIRYTNRFFNMFSAILVSFVLIQSVTGLVHNAFVSSSTEKSAKIPHAKNINRELPDIYYIIADGFGRSDILKELYGLDNSSFINGLEKEGFVVPSRAVTSYCQTHIVLASVFNHMYLNDLVKDQNMASANRMLYRTFIKNNTVIPYLKSKGYEYIFMPGSHSTEELRNGADRVLNPGGFNINNFGHMLIKNSIASFFGKKEPVEYDIHRRRILYNFHMLSELPKEENGGRFILSYLVCPHPPFVFDKNGNFKRNNTVLLWTDGDHIGYPKEEYIAGYKAQAEYIGKKLLETVEDILKKSKKPPVIIIHGDHGPGSKLVWTSAEKTYVKERFSVLDALYFPGVEKPEIPENVSIINNFLLIKKYAFGEQVELLENRSYFSPWYRPYELTDVTDRVNE